MRSAYAHGAVLVLEDAGDERAPGGAITLALCGSRSHDPAEATHPPVAAPPGTWWSPAPSPSPVAVEEQAHAQRLVGT